MRLAECSKPVGDWWEFSCAPPHFHALSCNGRLPEPRKINSLSVTARTHNAGVNGSNPSLSTIKSVSYELNVVGLSQP